MNKQKRVQSFKWLEDQAFSFCLLQETHSTHHVEQFWKSQWKGTIYFSGKKSNRKECAINKGKC